MAFQQCLTKQFDIKKILELIQFEKSEKKRLELIQSKKFSKFSEKLHPKVIIISKALSSLISESLSINSSNIE